MSARVATARSIEEEFAAWYSNVDPALVADPYPFFDRLRAESPVHRQAGLVVFSRYSECAAAAIDPRLEKTDGKRYDYGSLDRGSLPDSSRRQLDELFQMERLALNKTEGEEHSRLRGLVQTAFAPRMIERLEQRIVEVAESLIDEVAGTGRMDAIDDLAYQLPLIVISEMLEVPTEDRHLIREWGLGMSGLFGGVRDDVAQVIDDAHRNRKELFAYIHGIVERRRRSTRRADSVMSLLLEAGADGRISDKQLIAVLAQFVFAGHETTTNAIGNAIVALMTHRDQWELLCADLALARGAADEALRYLSPVQTEPRYATVDVMIGEAQVRHGDRVRMIWAAANRDPERFVQPDRFDIRRRDNKHLAFGVGRHYCLGASLARAEIATALAALARRFPDMRMRDERPRWRPSFNVRGVTELPLELGRDRG